jgi:MoxR-like ATPase
MATGTYAGTEDYIASPELTQTVNVAVVLGRRLLIKGQPGTGKTMVAASIAKGLGLRVIPWNWVQALIVGGVGDWHIRQRLPFIGVLLKKDRDVEAAQRALPGGRR